MITHGLGFVGQVVEVYPNTVPTHQARSKRQEVPLGAGRGQYFVGVDVHASKDHHQIVTS